MEVPSSLYGESDFTGSDAGNRRRTGRLRVATSAVVWIARDVNAYGRMEPGGSFEVAKIESISSNGLSLSGKRPYLPETELWIRFHIGSKVCQLRGVVRHRADRSLSPDTKRYVSGIEFVVCHQTAHAQSIVCGYLAEVHGSRIAKSRAEFD